MAESAVFLNILRYEKSKSLKKNINHDHRNNYHEFTRSGIFNTVNEVATREKSVELKRNKTLGEFTPKYKNEDNIDRKAKEFYNDKVIHKIHKEIPKKDNFKTDPIAKPSKVLNSTEVKLKQLYPDLSLAEIEKLKNKNLINKYNTEKNLTSRQRKIVNMHSNIFHDPEKTLLSTKSIFKKVKEEPKDIKNPGHHTSRKIEKFKTGSFVDWSKTNTEIVFKNSAKNFNEKIDPKSKKMNNLKSALDSDRYSHVKVESVKLETSIKEKLDNEITSKVKERIRDNSKYKRALDNISSLHDKDFYKTSLTEKSPFKNVDRFEINNIQYENFNLKEFKGLYMKNGIHVFDINLHGKYGDGNSKGSITFKIRKNEDIEGFSNKLSEVNSIIKNHYKSDVKCFDNKNRKPKTDLLSTNIKWETTDVNNFSKHRDFDKTNHRSQSSRKLEKSDRWASNKTLHDTSYKNDRSGKKVFKKF